MYLKDLMGSLLRRWYLFLVALALTAGACVEVVHMVGPTYEQSASVVLLPPKSPTDQDSNRYLDLGSLSQAVDVLVRSLQSDATHEQVVPTPGSGDYGVAPDPTTSAPIAVITVTAKTPGAAATILAAVLAQVPKNLTALQSNLNIDADARITSIVVAQDQRPRMMVKPQLRAGAAASVVVLAGLALLIGAADGLLLRRRRGRGLRPVDEPAGGVDSLSKRRKDRAPSEDDDEDPDDADPTERRTLLRRRAR